MVQLIDKFRSWMNRGKVGPSAPDSNRFGGHAYGSFGDVKVTPDSATQVAAIWACMDVIAGSLASSDWNIYQGYRGEGDKKAIPRDRLQQMLNERWNVEMTAQAGKRAVMLNAVGMGTGYAEIEWDLANRPVGLWPVLTTRAEPRRDERGRLFTRFYQDGGNSAVDIDNENLVIIRGPSLAGFSGDNMLSRAIRTVSNALALEHFSEAYFANFAQLGTVFFFNGNLDDAHYERAKSQIEGKHTGVKRAYKTGFFEGGDWKVQTFGSNMDQSAFSEIKAGTVDDICRWFHVPPHKIAHLAKSTNNNIEHQGLEFSRDTLRPWVKEIEQETGYKLISARGEPKFVEIDVDWTEQGDYKSRLEAYAIARNMGVFSANDVLRKLGENTIGVDGDIRIVQGANVRLEDVGAAYLDAPGKAKPAAEPKDDPTLTAWLSTLYARVQRRYVHVRQNNGAPAARASALNFGIEILADLPRTVDADRVAEGLQKIIEGGDPPAVAQEVLGSKK